jgi:hypothetical protein
MQNPSQFSIYRYLSSDPKRAEEANTLMPLLSSLAQFIKLEDVEYGQDPPDFVFRPACNRIGVELTDLVPKVFRSGGFARKADFKPWQLSAKKTPKPRHEFEWGGSSLRESLAAFENQFDGKIQKVKKWRETFSENWLLLHVGNGSPFGELVATRRNGAARRTVKMDDFVAKTTHSIFSICQRPHPFQQVILFSGMVFLAFPANGRSPCPFPVPSPDVLARGAAASDSFLDWRCTRQSFIEHPLLESETKLGATPA